MKIVVAMCGVLAALAVSGCTDIKGPHVMFRSEPLPPVVVSTYNPLTDLDSVTSMREQQVDMAVVLATGLGESNGKVDYEVNRAELKTNGTLHLGALSPDQRLNALITFTENSLGDDDLKKLRNSVASQLISASNANCATYLGGLRGGQVTSRLATDMLALGFSLSGTLAKGAATAKRLSAYAGVANGIGATIDRDIFSQQAAELIADAIVQKRDTLETGLEKRFNDTYMTWPLATVLANVTTYHQECTVMRGLSSMREVIIAREQTVAAIRNAAQAVALSGGDAKQVVAVLAGLDPVTSKSLVVSPESDMPASGLQAKADDLTYALRKAQACRDAILEAHNVVDPTKVGTCQTDDTGSWKRYLDTYTSEMALSQPDISKISKALSAPKITEDETQAQLKLLAAAYASHADNADKANDADIKLRSGKREAAVQALAMANSDIKAPVLKGALDGLLLKDDPLLPTIDASIATSSLEGPGLTLVASAAWQAEYNRQLKLYRPPPS